ncbi:MAG: response regulator transcription factor [Dermatophilaceae bacterium]
MRLVIAEDSGLLRAGLVEVLTRTGHEVVAAVGDAPALLAAVETHRPDVAITDVRMPPGQRDEGLLAALEMRRRRPDQAVVVLSQYVEPQYAADLLDVGAGGVGYLLKDAVAEVADFVDSLGRVAAGGTVLDPEVVRQVLRRRRDQAPLARLTDREREVLAVMAEGKSNAAIARALVVSEAAVAKHVNGIFAKLDLPVDPEDHRRVLAVLAYLRA